MIIYLRLTKNTLKSAKSLIIRILLVINICGLLFIIIYNFFICNYFDTFVDLVVAILNIFLNLLMRNLTLNKIKMFFLS